MLFLVSMNTCLLNQLKNIVSWNLKKILCSDHIEKGGMFECYGSAIAEKKQTHTGA